MLRSAKDPMELITFLVGEYEPPHPQIELQVAFIVVSILRRHEAWLELLDEYRQPRGGRPKIDVDEALPEAKARLENGESIRKIAELMGISYSTLRRRLSK